MATFVLNEIKKLKLKYFGKKKIKILVLGFTFKENISDTRNSQVVKIIKKMSKKIFDVYAFDPNVDKNFYFSDKRIKLIRNLKQKNFYDSIFIGTPHRKIIQMGGKTIKSFCKKKSFIYDLKSSIEKKYIDGSLC